MKIAKRALAGTAAVLALALGAASLLWVPAVQDRLLGAAVAKRVTGADAWAAPPDGLRVVLCGTSPPPPSQTRAKSCAVVIAGDRAFVVDTGPGSANRLSQWRFPMQNLSGVLLTHFHSDHVGDLGEFRMQSWASGRKTPLVVHGPAGVEEVVEGINRAYAWDDRHRGVHHGLDPVAAALTPRPFGLADAGRRNTHDAETVVLDEDGLRITAFQVDHEPVFPAVGYRFDYKGRSVVFSGDTVRSANLIANARGADVLFHEAQSEHARRILVEALKADGQTHLARVMTDVARYHLTPAEAAQVANEAGVRLLVFNHLGPIPPDNWLTTQVFARGLSDARPSSQWRLGFDGLVIDLPAGGEEFRRSRVR